MEVGSRRILGFVYKNLRNEGIPDEQLRGCSELYGVNWMRNPVLLRQAAQVIEGLRILGVETMLLKGAAMVSQYYADYGLRYMEDVDLLVPHERRFDAVAALYRMGWRNWQSEEALTDALERGHSNEFSNGQEQKIDLHWRVFHTHFEVAGDGDFWPRARSCRVNESETRIPDASDLLLHIFTHGAQWTPWQFVQWVVDASWILGFRPAGSVKNSSFETVFDWDRFVEASLKRGLSLPVHDCLSYLRSELNAPVPGDVLKTLARAETTPKQNAAYLRRTVRLELQEGFDTFTRFREIWRVVFARDPGDNRSGARQMLERLKKEWNAENGWYLPWIATVKLTRRVRRFVGWKFSFYSGPRWRSKRISKESEAGSRVDELKATNVDNGLV